MDFEGLSGKLELQYRDVLVSKPHSQIAKFWSIIDVNNQHESEDCFMW